VDRPSMDPELLAPGLDLSRPELEQVRRRYAPPEVLIVGPNRGVPVEDGLIERGWHVTICEGPGKATCPLMRGEECYLRTEADVALVHVDPSRGTLDGGLLARVRCAVEGGSPALIALDGRFDPARVESAAATIGAARSVEEIVAAVEEQLPTNTKF
jgi:hypothetical protein